MGGLRRNKNAVQVKMYSENGQEREFGFPTTQNSSCNKTQRMKPEPRGPKL